MLMSASEKNERHSISDSDLIGADTRIILQPFLDFSETSLGCLIILVEYPRIIPRMLVCYEGADGSVRMASTDSVTEVLGLAPKFS